MKKKTKIIIALAVACAGTFVLAACASGSRYKQYAEEGYSVLVRYDSNGGRFVKENVNVVHVLPADKVKEGVYLTPPEKVDGNDLTISREGYFFAGWYETREPRVDGSGNPLDEDGVLCSVSGEDQGYIYSDPWDFEHDIFKTDKVEYVEGEYSFVLYAAWVPNYECEFYSETENGWELYDTFSYNPEQQTQLPVPSWSERTGAMEYGQFPSQANKTFRAAYADPDKQEQIEMYGGGEWDKDHALAVDRVSKVYVVWDEGVWFHIRTADQLIDNARSNGCYEIYENLDFTEKNWPISFSSGDFAGIFRGNGHTISNVSVRQTGTNLQYGGLFARIRANAQFEEISFENITYTLAGGSRIPDAQFGLFTGDLSRDAKMESVVVTGTLAITNEIYPQLSDGNYRYEIGLCTGNFFTEGIDYQGVVLAPGEGVTASAEENGRVTVTAINS